MSSRSWGRLAACVLVVPAMLAAVVTSAAADKTELPSPPKAVDPVTLLTARAPLQVQEFLALDAYLQGWQRYYDEDAYLQGLQRYQDEQAAKAVATQRSTVRTTTPSTAPVTSSSSMGAFLDCVRQRESGGDYTIHNSGGSGASGAYQFLPGTWNSTAQAAGRGDLVGVDPAHASPADQDAMARQLYATSGTAPWAGGNYSC